MDVNVNSLAILIFNKIIHVVKLSGLHIFFMEW